MLQGFPADARSFITQSQDLISNEIRFTSEEEGALRWQTGLFQMWIDNDGTAVRTTEVPGLFPTVNDTTRFEIEQLNLAGFGNVTWQANASLTLDAGLRLDYHESEIDRVKRDITTATSRDCLVMVTGDTSAFSSSCEKCCLASVAVIVCIFVHYRQNGQNRQAIFTVKNAQIKKPSPGLGWFESWRGIPNSE